MRVAALLYCLFTVHTVANGLKCYECSAFDADCETGECEGTWCTTSIAEDKNANSRTVSKYCNPTSPGTESSSGCVKLVDNGSASTVCGCNNGDFCNNQEETDKLIEENTQIIGDTTPPDFGNLGGGPNVKCVSCVMSNCDLKDGNPECTGEWCTYATVYETTGRLQSVTKGCAPVSSGEGEGCIRVLEKTTESLSCSCKSDYCTNNDKLEELRANAQTFDNRDGPPTLPGGGDKPPNPEPTGPLPPVIPGVKTPPPLPVEEPEPETTTTKSGSTLGTILFAGLCVLAVCLFVCVVLEPLGFWAHYPNFVGDFVV